MASQVPPSFKANLNRNKTKKWAEARTLNYDGDDWGGGDDDAYANAAGDSLDTNRRNSFEAGEERRAFSSENHPPPGPHAAPMLPMKDPPVRRDFSQPAHIPPPLKMSPDPDSAGRPSMAQEKSLPAPVFVRPSDIYKRMEEERQKERKSLENTRSSDSTPAPPDKDTKQQAQRTGDLSAVQEVNTPVLPPSSTFKPPAPADNNTAEPSKPILGHVRQQSSGSRLPTSDFAKPASPVSPVRQFAAPRAASPSPIQLPGTGRHSPAPGRVRHLADKYNVIGSREGSPTSPTSKGSFSSWERSDDGGSKRSETPSSPNRSTPAGLGVTGAPSELQDLPGHQNGLRPQIPGQWVSYGSVNPPELPAKPAPNTPQPTKSILQDTEDADLTPRVRQIQPSPLASNPVEHEAQNAVEAVKAAGHALASALMVNNAGTEADKDATASGKSIEQTQASPPQRAVGDVALRPLTLDRAASSFDSTDPPTPLQKDTPTTESHAPESFTTSMQMAENDRLRRDIVKSLDPLHDRQSPEDKETLPTVPLKEPKADFLQGVTDAQPPQSFLEKRFSWENSSNSLGMTSFLPKMTIADNERPISGLQTVSTVGSEESGAIDREVRPEPIETSPVSPIDAPPISDIERPTTSDSTKSSDQLDPNKSLPPITGIRTRSDTLRPASAQIKIPSYRELITIKSTNERLAAFDKARHDTYLMDTGLGSWLAFMLDARPELEHSNGMPRPEHTEDVKPGPSIARLAKSLAPSHTVGDDHKLQPATSHTASEHHSQGLQKSKELLGKGVVGAKGWLAKGKQKLRESSASSKDNSEFLVPKSKFIVSVPLIAASADDRLEDMPTATACSRTSDASETVQGRTRDHDQAISATLSRINQNNLGIGNTINLHETTETEPSFSIADRDSKVIASSRPQDTSSDTDIVSKLTDKQVLDDRARLSSQTAVVARPLLRQTRELDDPSSVDSRAAHYVERTEEVESGHRPIRQDQILMAPLYENLTSHPEQRSLKKTRCENAEQAMPAGGMVPGNDQTPRADEDPQVFVKSILPIQDRDAKAPHVNTVRASHAPILQQSSPTAPSPRSATQRLRSSVLFRRLSSRGLTVLTDSTTTQSPITPSSSSRSARRASGLWSVLSRTSSSTNALSSRAIDTPVVAHMSEDGSDRKPNILQKVRPAQERTSTLRSHQQNPPNPKRSSTFGSFFRTRPSASVYSPEAKDQSSQRLSKAAPTYPIAPNAVRPDKILMPDGSHLAPVPVPGRHRSASGTSQDEYRQQVPRTVSSTSIHSSVLSSKLYTASPAAAAPGSRLSCPPSAMTSGHVFADMYNNLPHQNGFHAIRERPSSWSQVPNVGSCPTTPHLGSNKSEYEQGSTKLGSPVSALEVLPDLRRGMSPISPMGELVSAKAREMIVPPMPISPRSIEPSGPTTSGSFALPRWEGTRPRSEIYIPLPYGYGDNITEDLEATQPGLGQVQTSMTPQTHIRSFSDPQREADRGPNPYRPLKNQDPAPHQQSPDYYAPVPSLNQDSHKDDLQHGSQQQQESQPRVHAPNPPAGAISLAGRFYRNPDLPGAGASPAARDDQRGESYSPVSGRRSRGRKWRWSLIRQDSGPIVMASTAYPGQEWVPAGYAGGRA